MKPEPIRVVERKLGRHKADGLAWKEERLIEIDPRLEGEEYLLTLIHEILHVSFPKLSEIEIIGKSREVATVVWSQGYRRIKI
jgi:hypothetical protein